MLFPRLPFSSWRAASGWHSSYMLFILLKICIVCNCILSGLFDVVWLFLHIHKSFMGWTIPWTSCLPVFLGTSNHRSNLWFFHSLNFDIAWFFWSLDQFILYYAVLVDAVALLYACNKAFLTIMLLSGKLVNLSIVVPTITQFTCSGISRNLKRPREDELVLSAATPKRRWFWLFLPTASFSNMLIAKHDFGFTCFQAIHVFLQEYMVWFDA